MGTARARLTAVERTPGEPLMNSNSRAILRVLYAIAAAVQAEVSTETYKVYVQVLQHIPLADLEAAATRCMSEIKWWPKIPEILERLPNGPRQIQQREQLEADQVWNAISHFAGGHSCICGGIGQPLTEAGRYAVTQVGGWRAICNVVLAERPSADSVHFLKENFLEAYARHAETGGLLAPSREEARRLLAGLHGETKQLAACGTGGA